MKNVMLASNQMFLNDLEKFKNKLNTLSMNSFSELGHGELVTAFKIFLQDSQLIVTETEKQIMHLEKVIQSANNSFMRMLAQQEGFDI